VDWINNGDIKKAHKTSQPKPGTDDRPGDQNQAFLHKNSKRLPQNENYSEGRWLLLCSIDKESRQRRWVLLRIQPSDSVEIGADRIRAQKERSQHVSQLHELERGTFALEEQYGVWKHFEKEPGSGELVVAIRLH
jgi:hypothetical protein